MYKNIPIITPYGEDQPVRNNTKRLLMVLSCIAGGLLATSFAAHTADNLEGGNGVLYVQGTLTESACRLDMSSAFQEVWMGNLGMAALSKAGDEGVPVAVELQLRDCLHTPAGDFDAHTGVVSWSRDQPTASLGFIAPADINSPELVQVNGITGLALRLTDKQHQDVRLGSLGKPLFLSPGQDTLAYYVTPVRTSAPLQAGAYWSSIAFHINYD